jgi:transposase
VLLYAIHAITRFPRGQDCLSYCRLVTGTQESAGKRDGTSGTQIGNAHLTWACSEAAVLFLRANPAGQKYLTKLEKKHGSGKALTLLGQKLGRTVYYMLQRQTAFDMGKFLNG